MNKISANDEFAQRQSLQVSSAAALSIAVGIVVFNNSDAELADLARSLRRAVERLIAAESSIAVSVSVNLHDNGTRPADITPFGPSAHVTRSPENLGFGRAHNLLMRRAFAEKADFYITANPDGLFHPDALIELIALARRHEGRALIEAAQFPDELPKIFDPLTLDTPWSSACCLVISAEIFNSLDGFDENFFLFCEDVDFSWRARRAGFSVKYAPRALFKHRWVRPKSYRERQRARFNAGRYLAAKWGDEKFGCEIERMMVAEDLQPATLPDGLPSCEGAQVADFNHAFSFAPLRWKFYSPIPVHSVACHPEIDNTIDVVVRFHDIAQRWRLSRCLFALYSQEHRPIQVIVVLPAFEQASLAAVQACVDDFDWSAPRRKPLVINVETPEIGDHRARLWNAGLEAGRARYVGFCDYDDLVYPDAYGYLLHRLQVSGAAAAFASSVHVDYTPMSGFDVPCAKRRLPGDDRVDFFLENFCPANSALIDRTAISPGDLRADETMRRAEGYRVLVTIVAKYETDWSSIGTAVSEHWHRTDGSKTDVAALCEWKEAEESVRRDIATLSLRVPVADLMRMRSKERALQAQLADELDKYDRMRKTFAWRLVRPIREAERWVLRLKKALSGRQSSSS